MASAIWHWRRLRLDDIIVVLNTGLTTQGYCCLVSGHGQVEAILLHLHHAEGEVCVSGHGIFSLLKLVVAFGRLFG